MIKHFRVLLSLCIFTALPLCAQTAELASSERVADTPALAEFVFAPSAARNFAPSVDSGSPKFWAKVVASQKPVYRAALPSEPVIEQPAGAEKSAPSAPASFSSPAGPLYWALNAALLASSIANAETLHDCPRCTFVPDSLHRRGALYGIGLPINAGVAYMGYSLKKSGHRWWFAPALALTAANGFLAYHWASN